jgi:hypothetical protein
MYAQCGNLSNTKNAFIHEDGVGSGNMVSRNVLTAAYMLSKASKLIMKDEQDLLIKCRTIVAYILTQLDSFAC